MKSITARCGRYNLLWFWSGYFWYVTVKDRSTYKGSRKYYPVGSGKTKDEAYKEFKALLTTKQNNKGEQDEHR